MLNELRRVHLNHRRVGNVHLTIAVCVGSFQLFVGQVGELGGVPLHQRRVGDVHLCVAVDVPGRRLFVTVSV